jgi:hypothetical protein
MPYFWLCQATRRLLRLRLRLNDWVLPQVRIPEVTLTRLTAHVKEGGLSAIA